MTKKPYIVITRWGPALFRTQLAVNGRRHTLLGGKGHTSWTRRQAAARVANWYGDRLRLEVRGKQAHGN